MSPVPYNSGLNGSSKEKTSTLIDMILKARSLEPKDVDAAFTKDVEYKSSLTSDNSDQVQYMTGVGPEEEDPFYRTDQASRGKLIIFNHTSFDNTFERNGTNIEAVVLEETFVKFGFQVTKYNDLNLQDLEYTLEDIATEDHTTHYCLIVAILTHGRNQLGFLQARDKEYNVNLLLSSLTSKKCPTLAGKPKIFIIQVCERELMKNSGPKRERDYTLANPSFYYAHVEADILLTFSTYAGCKFHNGKGTDTGFIQEFCKELIQNAKRVDIISVITNVIRHLATKKEYMEEVQFSITQSTLTRKLFLYPTDAQQQLKIEKPAEVENSTSYCAIC